MRVISWILIAFGSLALISVFMTDLLDSTDGFYKFSIALSFLVLGALGLEYKRKAYLGGIPSIIGAVFVILSLQFGVLTIEQYFHGLDVELIRGAFLATIVFIIPGIILLRYGHKTHISKS